MMSTEIRRTQSFTEVETPSVRRFRIDALLYAIVLFSWVAVWRIQDLFPILASVKFPIFVQIAGLILFFSDQTSERRIQWIRSPVFTMTMALLAVMVIGLPFSLWVGQSITFLTRDFLPTYFLMILVATSMRESSDLNWFAFAHLCGATLYAAMIFLFHPVSYDGRLAELVYYDANDFAMLLVCTIPFSVYFLRPGVIWWQRLTALSSLILSVVMIMRSGSRGGFLGFIAVMLYILFRYKAIPTRLRIGAVLGGALLLVGIGSNKYWEMMSTLLNPKDDYNMTADVGRKAVWKRGIGYMLTHPVLGVGVRAFPQAEGMISDIAKKYRETGRGIKWSVAHNSFVEIGAECGITGLVLFLSIIGVSMRNLSRIRAGPKTPTVTPEDAAFAQMLIASFVGYIVSGFFVSAEYFAYLYVLLGLVLGQQAILRRRLLQKPSARPEAKTNTHMQPSPSRHTHPVHWIPTGP